MAAMNPPLSKDGPGQELVKWAETYGASVTKKARFLEPREHGDRSCVVVTLINEHEELLMMPRYLTFETSPARPLDVPHALMDLLEKVTECDDDRKPVARSLSVALLLHYERLKADASIFGPYIKALPSEFPTMPLLDSVVDGELLDKQVEDDRPCLYKGTGVEMLVQACAALSGPEGIAMMRYWVETLDPDGFYWHHAQRGNDDLLRWAAAAVQSRAHSSKGGRTALVPLADAFNHSAASPNIELVENETCFRVRALRDIEAGEELLLSYGNFSNAELLFNAGFTCVPNPSDCILLTKADVTTAVQASWHRKAIQAPDLATRCSELWGRKPFPRIRASAPFLGGAVSAELVSLLVGLTLDQDSWVALVNDGKNAMEELYACWSRNTPEAEIHRHEVIFILQGLIDNCLQPRYFSTRLDDDKVALNVAESSLKSSPCGRTVGGNDARVHALVRRVNILRVRAGERKVLESLAATLNARMASAADGDQLKRKRVEEVAQ